MAPPQQLSKREREAFQTDILIPIRLRLAPTHPCVCVCTPGMLACCVRVCVIHIHPQLAICLHLLLTTTTVACCKQFAHTALMCGVLYKVSVWYTVLLCRVVHALQVWIARSYDDFKDGHTTRSLLNKFLHAVER